MGHRPTRWRWTPGTERRCSRTRDDDTKGVQNDETTREVAENSTADVGNPVTATDPDPNSDALDYTLSGADAGLFSVGADDSTTPNVDEGGQIKVKSGAKLDYETKQTYSVTLKAADSFGDYDTIVVTIMVTQVNEPPKISVGGLAITGLAGVSYAEDRQDAVATYSATGPESANAMWSLDGDDAGDFEISSSGELTFVRAPDYENAADADTDNVYMVTITADDGTYMAMRNVTVTVTNENEDGTVTLSSTQPVVDTELTATLTDLDSVSDTNTTGSITTSVTWQWARSMDMNSWMDIDGETIYTYIPTMDDDGMYLRVTAMYTDGHGPGKRAMAVSVNMVSMASTNTVPMFPDTEDGAREVAENTAAGEPVGAPVTAMDADNDTLTYSLDGTDMASFTVDNMGQIMVGAGTMLDYETKATYSVTVTASDSGGLSDSIDVTITVTNVDEQGEVTLWAGDDALTMAPQVGDTITGAVMDPDGGVTGESWQWSRTTTPAMMDSWMDIADETNAAYTVTADDTGYYLRVMATYTDAAGTDMAMEYSPATMMVGAMVEDPLLAKYDDDKDGWIQLEEARDAVGDYFGPPKGEKLSLDDTRKVVGLYFEYKGQQ